MSLRTKCGASPEMVKEHIQTLKELDNRTVRIEAYAVATVVILTLLGGWEYFKDRADKKISAVAIEKIQQPVSIANVKLDPPNITLFQGLIQ